MGRMLASVKIANATKQECHLVCDALVDTGAGPMVLPLAWKDRLSAFDLERDVQLQTAAQKVVSGLLCGPARVQIESFNPIHTDVLFIEMARRNGEYEPLLGYIPLEQASVAVDMPGHRLVHVKLMDLK